jgi:hypothetical protein
MSAASGQADRGAGRIAGVPCASAAASTISRSAAISCSSALRPARVALIQVRGLRPSKVFSIWM